VAKWLPYFFAAVFAAATIGSTIWLVHFTPEFAKSWFEVNGELVFRLKSVDAWLEWLICLTLLGLIVGNILKGTALMRCSFIANRVFNIINHVHFANIIAVIIAIAAIGSNIVFYIREFIAWLKERKKINSETDYVDYKEKSGL
jgi:hypothetical protein